MLCALPVGRRRTLTLQAPTTTGVAVTQMPDTYDGKLSTVALARPTSHAQRTARQCSQGYEPSESLACQVHALWATGAVLLLLGPCCPAAVSWGVVPVVVNAVKSLLVAGAWSHVLIKRREAVQPCMTHIDATASVPMKPPVSRVQASVLHRRPRAVFGLFPQGIPWEMSISYEELADGLRWSCSRRRSRREAVSASTRTPPSRSREHSDDAPRDRHFPSCHDHQVTNPYHRPLKPVACWSGQCPG